MSGFQFKAWEIPTALATPLCLPVWQCLSPLDHWWSFLSSALARTQQVQRYISKQGLNKSMREVGEQRLKWCILYHASVQKETTWNKLNIEARWSTAAVDGPKFVNCEDENADWHPALGFILYQAMVRCSDYHSQKAPPDPTEHLNKNLS